MSSPDILSSKNGIRNFLKEYKIFPLKRLGQNFLISRAVLKRIIEAAEIQKNETILEIGPAVGTLTLELVKRAKMVITVEKDERMIEILKKNLGGYGNIRFIQGDILKYDLSKQKRYKIVANIPYYLTSPLIRKVLEFENKPKLIVLMVQKEVAQRICAKPPKMNLLAVSVQFYSKPEIITYVSKKSFWPEPKVDSAILKIIPTIDSERIKIDKNLFFEIARAGFSQPRKQIANNLSKMLGLEKEKIKVWLWKNKISPNQRAETLGIKNWINLVKTFDKHGREKRKS